MSRRLRTPTTAAAVAAILTAGVVSATGATARPTPARDHNAPGPVVSTHVTAADGSQLMAPQAPLSFTRKASDLTTITVDPSTHYQRMDGFGGALTDSSASLLSGLSPQARTGAMRKLFDPTAGIGVSFLRQPIGSSDFTAAAQHYTFDDVAPGATDYGLKHFSIAQDQAQILPLLRQAKRLNPSLQVVATPWSPPAWMKTGDSLVGGRLIDSPAIYRAYARYLTRFVQAYTRAGVPIDFITVQNEPQNRKPKGYPGTDMPVAQEAAVIEALGPMLRKASPDTKILGYDHNWTTHPDDVANTPPGQDPETDYPYRLLRSPAAKWLAGTAYHCYSGDPSAQTALHDAFPTKGIWFTECSGSHGPSDTPAQYFRGTLTWHARNITLGTTRNWAKSVADWNLVLDEKGGPHLGGCDTCTGLLTVHPDGSVTTNAEYYTIGHLSKFVHRGAVRIASTSFGTTGWNGQLMDSAFRNPDGSTALVVHNENDNPRSFAVAVGDRSFEYTLPGGALATFTWPRSRELDRHKTRPLSLAGTTVTTNPAGDGSPATIVDNDGSTRWASGQGQTPGQYVQLDLGRTRSLHAVAVDSGDNLGDYARSWTLSQSRDGLTWSTVASGTGTGQLTTVRKHVTARYLRITNTGSAGSWWSVAEVRLYR